MRTKKGFKAEIYWKSNFEESFFTKMLAKCGEKYGVLIVKGLTSPVNVLCIFHEVDKDGICVETIPWLRNISFRMKKVVGFALLEQKEIRVIMPEDVKLPKKWGQVK